MSMPAHSARNGRHETTARHDHLWVLAVIAVCCLIKVWPSWVGIGAEARFPKIGHMPTDWTLAVVVEAYWAYAVYAWLAASAGLRSRRFAMWSAAGVFVLSVGVQSAAGLMSVKAAGAIANAMPVTVLALIAILVHMRHLDRAEADEAGERSTVQEEMDALRAERDGAVTGLAAARAELAGAVAKAEELARKLEAATARKSRPATGRKPARATARKPEPATAPEEGADVDREALVLKYLAEGKTASEAGRLAGLSDSRGRQISRALAKAAPKGPEE